MALNSNWTTENGFCVKNFPLHVPVDTCEYLVSSTDCPEGGCQTFTNTLSEGELAIIDRSGKILSPTAPFNHGDFMFAMGGVDGWNSTSLLINKKNIKGVYSHCPTTKQAEKWRILFSDVQCDTDYTLSFTVSGEFITSSNSGSKTLFQSSTVTTGCCDGCNTEGNAIDLAKKFAKDINSANFCNKNLKSKYIKATAICGPVTVKIPDPTLCPGNDCLDCIADPLNVGCIDKVYEAGLEIEGLFYSEYCDCCHISPYIEVMWDGVSFTPFLGGVLSDNGWSCNVYKEKTQQLTYDTGKGCDLRKLEMVWNREKVNPLTGTFTEYFNPAPIKPGILTCDCDTQYCILEIISNNQYSYAAEGRDIHTYIMLPSTMSDVNKNTITTFLNTALDCHASVNCICTATAPCDVTIIPKTYGSDTGGHPTDNE